MKLDFARPDRPSWTLWLVVSAVFLQLGANAQPFVHPGGLHTQADFDRMKAKVAVSASPWVDSYNQLTTVAEANTSWGWAPVTQIIRGPTGSNFSRSQKDALAIYYLALRWRISGDTNFAEKAIQGCSAWSSTMTNGVGGDSNWALGAGICGYEFAVAGEALRGYTNWSQTSISNYSNFLKIFAGGNDSFLANHNGTCDSHYWCNWDACNVASLMACAVFVDDTNMFNRGVTYIEEGKGNGNMASAAWYIHTNGLAQWQESGRDQAHTMDGVAWLGVACQVAWNQGVDLFGFDNNRFLRGLEYCAKYNLGNDVPFVSFFVCEGANFAWGTTTLSAGSRGFLPPTWDLFYNHYVNIKGLSAPYTAQAAALIRPDGFYNNGNSPDFVGFNTLTCFLDPITEGAVPSGLTTSVSGTNVTLTWWGSAYATNYSIKRATISGGPYTTVGSVSSSADRYFVDSTVTNGGTYYYVVSALDKFGETPDSPETPVSILNQLVTYYRFNESSGTTATNSSGVNPSAALMNGASFTSGKFGNGVNLSGSSQYVALPNGVLSGLNDCTIATWVYFNSVNTWARIFDFGADIDRYMFLTPSDGSTIRFAISKFSGNGEQHIDGTSALSAGSWHHVAVTFKGREASGIGVLYVDGVPVGTNSAMYYTPDMIGSLVNCTNNFIGRSQFGGDPYLNGRVDDFRIYNGALSAAQIAALYALSPVAPAAPAAVTATAASASVINLSWTAVSGATNYLVQRALVSGGPYAVVASGITATNYTDTSLSGSMTYYYVIAAVNAGGEGTNSLEASATTLTPPPVPSSLTATGIYGGQTILSWDASAGATSYNVKRALVSGGPYITVATGVSTAGYTNVSLILGLNYFYVVSAVNASGESANSAEAGAIAPIPTMIWQGNVNTNWDINTTTNWLFSGSPGTYFDGSATIFNDTAVAPNINLAADVAPYSIQFSNSTKNFIVNSANGSTIGGPATLTKFGTGTVTLNATNDFTGDITINSGTITVGGAGQLGGGTGGGPANYSGNIASYGTFNYNSSATQILSGQISLTGSVGKNGSGTLILSGANTYSGNTTVNGGAVVLQNSGTVKSSFLLIGNTSGSNAAVYQAGSSTLVSPGNSLGGLQVGSAAGGFGYYNLSAGLIALGGEIDVGGSSGGAGTFGQFDMTGGNVTLPNSSGGYFLPNRGAAGEASVVNISGGAVGIFGNGTPADGGANGFAPNWSGSGTGQTNTTTISGNGVFSTPSFSAHLNVGGNTANAANLNLNGGTFQVKSILPAAGASRLNFNGGTLKAGNTGGIFIGGGALQSSTIYSGGATIDDNGQSIAIDQSLVAPTGNGVATIPVTSGGAGYVVPPRVVITSASGSGATAHASISNGVVTGITVTCRGTGYTSAPAVALSGGGFTSVAVPGTPTISPNAGGGLTKVGSGTVTLTGANSYTGPTVVGAGTLKVGGPLLYLSFDNTSGTNVFNGGNGGAALNGTLTGAGASIVSGGRVGKALAIGTNGVNAGYVLINDPVVNFNNSGAWTWGMWIKSTNAGGAYLYQGSGGWGAGNTSFYLNPGSASAGTKGGGVRYAQGWETGTATLNDGNWHFIAMTCNNATKVFYVDGAVDAWAVNSWSGNATGNQLWIGGTADTIDGAAPLNGLIDEVYVYGRALNQAEVTNLMNGITATTSAALPSATALNVAPGATVALNVLSQTVGSLAGGNSGNVILGNGTNATAFTFGNSSSTIFAGTISGYGSVTKIGSGTTTISGVNTYTGGTVISNGAVNFGLSDNTNYVASLGPVLQLTFDQIGRTTLFTNENDGTVTTNTDNSIVNLGSGGAAMDGALNGAGATIVGGGRYGNALSLSGSSYLYIDDKVAALDCNPIGASWTYALWIKTATAGATYGYQGDGTWSSGATTFYLNSNGTSPGSKAGGVRYSQGWLTGTAALNNNAWHFITITVNAGVKTIYVDGNLDAQTGTTGWTGAASATANQFWIGGSPDTGDGVASFNGLIDEVYLFNRALSQSEVRNIMLNKTVIAAGIITGQLPAGSPVSVAPTGALDLSGTSQTIASLADVGGNGGIVTNSAGIPTTLTLSSASTNTFSGKIGDSSSANAISLIKNGSGTQTLNGANNDSGNTTINAGTLAFGQATLPTNGTVSVASGAVLSLNFTSTNRIAALVLNGANQPAGIYNSVNSAPYLAGTGSLQISDLVAMNPTNLSYAVSGGILTLSWPTDHIGWRLQMSTDLTGSNWVDLPAAISTNQISLPVSATNNSIFFRLVYP
jgi:autotransporter-associated beta strand protein